jgi:hypothetical protein
MRRFIVTALACATVVFGSGIRDAWALTISNPFHFSENRGPNPFVFATGHTQFFGATITPLGPSVMATATQALTTLNLNLSGITISPNIFLRNIPFNSSLTGSWQINATDGTTTAAPVSTRALFNPQIIPLVQNVQIAGAGVTPTLIWTLPDLTAFSVDRVQVRVQDAITEVQFFSSGNLPLTTTSFTIPSGVLSVGRPVVFRILLNDLIFSGPFAGQDNRSTTFSQVFTPVPEPGTLLLLGSGVVGMGAAARRRRQK